MADNATPITATETLKKEKDPALIAYLKSLGIDPDYQGPADDPRRVVIKEFSIIFKDHATPATLTFNTPEDIKNAKHNVLVIKEGSLYKMQIVFRVQHDAVSGFKIESKIMSALKDVKDVVMLGSYAPSNDFKPLEIPRSGWHEAPSGMAFRGDYKAKLRFTDDENYEHLSFDWTLRIAKEWPQ
eukprot:TRINITY_DN13758_c0_g1_i7.p1 TRINITY_DN13758_c0_g1~~TRINITY_DN13758_c0_g1_i7.p1  ORF type:complete len:184 (-),score=27.90 TRINITY_DN13758_c0_g1_i7:153-704(-)